MHEYRTGSVPLNCCVYLTFDADVITVAFHVKACSGPLKGSKETSERVLVIPVLSEDMRFIHTVLAYILWTAQSETSPSPPEPVTAIRDLDKAYAGCPPIHRGCVFKGVCLDSNS